MHKLTQEQHFSPLNYVNEFAILSVNEHKAQIDCGKPIH